VSQGEACPGQRRFSNSDALLCFHPAPRSLPASDGAVGAVMDPQYARSRADLSRELMEDRSAEMRELSRFLHDTVAQDLVKLSFFIHELPDEAVRAPAPAGIDLPAALALVESCCKSIRRISCILAPVSLAGVPLHSSLEQYLGYFSEETGLSVLTDFDPMPPLPAELETLLCTVVKRWLVRSLRSSRSALVTVRLRDRDGIVLLELETREGGSAGSPDNFLAGWSMVRECVAALGGEIAFISDVDRVRCRVQLPAF
jgi:signal transduction histidine kinase